MKKIFNYVVCSIALFVAIIATLSGGLWSPVGLAWSFMLYVSGVAFPTWWKMFWVTNIRILAYFNCL